MNDKESGQEFSNDQIARRKLLTLAAYVPPAILGVMIAGSKVAEAGPPGVIGGTLNCKSGMITVSAGGNACCPCVPGDPKYNPANCNTKRCRLGHCPSCGMATFPSQGSCNAEAAKTPCACTCTPVPGTGGGGRGGGGGFWQMTGC